MPAPEEILFAFLDLSGSGTMSANMQRTTSRFLIAALVVALSFAALVFVSLPRAAGQTEPSPTRRAQPPLSLRLYVFDCGTIHVTDLSRFSLKPEEVASTDLSIACFLITHPKGTLIWDAGAVPDSAWKPTGAASTQHLVLPDSQQREVILSKSLTAQLAELGYSPPGITYLALSHYHYDHTANANQFAGATWLVRQEERDAMFAEKPPGTTQPSTYAALRNSKTLILKTDDHDVFGDGSVIIKSAPGHTPGHQVLYVKLPKTGPVLLSGDLYHYHEERTLDRVPTFEFNPAQTRATRVAIDAFLKKTGAQLWIQHDFLGNAKLMKSPRYYE
jgi:glyoxylase-like metal-dependent hydrolase (beta-lactamase superfamily II)